MLARGGSPMLARRMDAPGHVVRQDDHDDVERAVAGAGRRARVLIVSPHFPPSNTPDMHRVRLLLPFLARHGWDAEVLAVDARDVAAPLDAWLLEGIPSDIPVHRVRALGRKWGIVPGLRGLAWRAVVALWRQGSALLRAKRFDLVYFSTTVAETQVLGAVWKARFNVPYVLDFQDPWVTDYYTRNPHAPKPGGALKHAVSQAINRVLESIAVRHCAGLTAVSAGYIDDLARRYPGLHKPSLVQAFPAAAQDFAGRVAGSSRQHAAKPDGAPLEWLYAGRAGGDIATSVRAILTALKRHAPEPLLRRLTLRFVGTSYAAEGQGRKTITPIAAACGLPTIVDEDPARLPYSRVLERLMNADALIIPASDDPNYTASKIYPYLLARKPLLVVCRAGGALQALIDRVGGAVCVGYGADDTAETIGERIYETWLKHDRFKEVVPLNAAAFATVSDEKCSEDMSAFLKLCAQP